MNADPMMLASSQSLPVPASYAEKAMASLMQLHGELMDEKERRVELFRRLMEKEQALAELRLYVKMLEERAAPAAPPSASFIEEPPSRPPRPSPVPPVPPAVGRRPDGWKVW